MMKKQFKIIALILCFVLLLPGSALADAAIGGEHNYQSADFYVVVDAPDGYVNFRYGPGLEYGINFPIYNGEVLYISATMDNYYDGLWWGQAKYGEEYGWISLSQTSFMEVPSAEPTYEWADQYNMVDAWDGYCNLRTGPGITYTIISPIYNGETLHVTEICYNPNDELYWGYTECNMGKGWISLSQTTQVPAPQSETQPEPQPQTQPETQPQTQPATQPQTGSEYLVSDAYYQEDGPYVYTIPVIHLDSVEIQDLNTAIYDEIYPQIQEALAETSPWSELSQSTYSWFLNGDILSLVIYYRYAGPWHEYKVYNISISQQKLLNNTAVIGAAGYTEQKYLDMAATAMEQSFINTNEQSLSSSYEKITEVYNKAHDETLTPDNIASAMPFINGRGDLCIIANIMLVMMQNSSSWGELDLVTPYSRSEYQDFYVRIYAPQGYTNLQSEPGPSGSIIGPIYNGQKVFIYSIVDNAEDGHIWGETYYNGKKGWIVMSEAVE